MLSSALVGRAVRLVAPECCARAWAAWCEASRATAGERREVGAILWSLDDPARVADVLEALGIDQADEVLAELVEPAAEPEGPVVVIRRHAEPGPSGLSSSGRLAAGLLASISPCPRVLCGPSLRTIATARAFTPAPEVVTTWGVPPSHIEALVGAHAPVTKWQSATGSAVGRYAAALAAALPQEQTLVISHDGVVQAAVCGLGVSEQLTRQDSFGHLEGVALRWPVSGAAVAVRVGAPPLALLGR